MKLKPGTFILGETMIWRRVYNNQWIDIDCFRSIQLREEPKIDVDGVKTYYVIYGIGKYDRTWEQKLSDYIPDHDEAMECLNNFFKVK